MKKLFALLTAVALVTSGCSLLKSEKQRFIDATIEATCLIFQSDNIFDPALEDQAKEIYANYGFDADDEDAMMELTTKYEQDAEVEEAITAGLEGCAGDLFNGLGDAMGDAMVEGLGDAMGDAVVEDAVMEEDATAEDAAMEETTVEVVE